MHHDRIPTTIRELLCETVERAKASGKFYGQGSSSTIVKIPGYDDVLLRFDSKYVDDDYGEASFRKALASSTSLTPPAHHYLHRNIGAALLQMDGQFSYGSPTIIEKQPGQSIYHHAAAYNVKAGREPLDPRGLHDVGQELLAYHQRTGCNPFTDFLTDVYLIEACYNLPGRRKADYNNTNTFHEPGRDCRWIDYINDGSLHFRHLPDHTSLAEHRDAWRAKARSVAKGYYGMEHRLRVDVLPPHDKHLTPLQRETIAGMRALLDEALDTAIARAEGIIESGQPIFGKVEGVQAVGLDDPPYKLRAAINALKGQRDMQRSGTGIVSAL